MYSCVSNSLVPLSTTPFPSIFLFPHLIHRPKGYSITVTHSIIGSYVHVVYIYIYIYIYMHAYVVYTTIHAYIYVYIYIYIDREILRTQLEDVVIDR